MNRTKFLLATVAAGTAAVLPLSLPTQAKSEGRFSFGVVVNHFGHKNKIRQINYYAGHYPYVAESNLVFPSDLHIYHVSGRKWFKVPAGSVVSLTTNGELWLREHKWYGPTENYFSTHRDFKQVVNLSASDDAVLIGWVLRA